MEIKDVKTILDIPNIENYLTDFFTLELYERGDRTAFYKCDLPNRHTLRIEIGTEESVIEGRLDLAAMLAHYDSQYFQFVERNDLDEIIAAYHYRPLIDEANKNY